MRKRDCVSLRNSPVGRVSCASVRCGGKREISSFARAMRITWHKKSNATITVDGNDLAIAERYAVSFLRSFPVDGGGVRFAGNDWTRGRVRNGVCFGGSPGWFLVYDVVARLHVASVTVLAKRKKSIF